MRPEWGKRLVNDSKGWISDRCGLCMLNGDQRSEGRLGVGKRMSGRQAFRLSGRLRLRHGLAYQ
jgi:hypothetical protein